LTGEPAAPRAPAGARRAERALLACALLAAVARVLVAGGGPRALLWTALALAAVATLAAAALGSPRVDRYRAALVLVLLLDVPQVYPRLGGDGYEYFGVARSLLLDHDLDLANDYAGLGASPVISPRGQVTARTPLGLSLLWMPVIAVAHVLAHLARALGAQVAADGFSAAYLASVTTASFLFGAAALLLVEGIVRRLYGPVVALICAALLWLATPLQFYSVANPFMSHAASALACAAFVAAWMRWRGRDEARPWLVLGLLGALMTLVRVQDGMLMALPLVDLLFSLRRPGARRRLAALAAGPAAAALLQSIVWARLWGVDFVRVLTTQGPGFRARPEVLNVLFSPWHGLFTWTPVYLVAVLGWLALLRRDPNPHVRGAASAENEPRPNPQRLALVTFGVFAAAVVLNAAMGDWWGSESFGQRRLLGLTPLFALGLAEAVALALRRPLVPVVALAAAAVLWNQQLAAVYNAELAGPRGGAIHLDRLLAAQGEMFDRQLARWEGRLPRRVWVMLYDHLRGVWLDEGTRSLGGRIELGGEEPPDLEPVLAHNWARPEAEGDVGFRRAKGRGARLRVPIRSLSDLTVVVRLRSDVPDEPQRVTLEVNGQSAGDAPVGAEWSELRFPVPAAWLRAGFNDVALAFSSTSSDARPGRRGRETAAAVDWIAFERGVAR